VGEQGVQEGTEHAPLGVPFLRISVADVLLPTLTTWGRPVRKSRIQLQREVFDCDERWSFDRGPITHAGNEVVISEILVEDSRGVSRLQVV
jgi:hypothetical protein